MPTSTWKPGQVGRVHPHGLRSELPVHRRGERPTRALSAATSACRSRRPKPAGASTRSSKFQLLPQSENIFLIYKDGWHPAEVVGRAPAPPNGSGRRRRRRISFRNPKKDAMFYLESDARVDQFPPRSRSRSGSATDRSARSPAISKDQKLRTFPITAAQLGNGRHGGARHRCRSHVHAGRDRHRASSASGSSTPSSTALSIRRPVQAGAVPTESRTLPSH